MPARAPQDIAGEILDQPLDGAYEKAALLNSIAKSGPLTSGRNLAPAIVEDMNYTGSDPLQKAQTFCHLLQTGEHFLKSNTSRHTYRSSVEPRDYCATTHYSWEKLRHVLVALNALPFSRGTSMPLPELLPIQKDALVSSLNIVEDMAMMHDNEAVYDQTHAPSGRFISHADIASNLRSRIKPLLRELATSLGVEIEEKRGKAHYKSSDGIIR